MNIEEYRNLLHEDIALAKSVSISTLEDEFLSYAIGLLINGEEFDDFNECHCEGITRRKGFYRMDGFSYDETDGSCCVFIVDYHGTDASDSVLSEDISAAFKKVRFFVEESISTELFREIQNPEAREFSKDLYFDSNKISKYRFYLITDAFNRQRAKTMKDLTIKDTIVELNIWDVERLYDLVCSQTQKESVEINFSNFGIKGIPCVKAVDFENVVADIDVVPKYNDDGTVENDNSNIVTYSSYLAVIPGRILNELYLEYGAKLLEGNVRSFLSAKGKVNKSIQNTIKNYPEMFFAYNNGIAATATDIETVMTPEGPKISFIRDLQIVNGGQTTASITNTFLNSKKSEIIDLDKIFVPIKISVLNHQTAEKIIPKISEYSNSQNKVDASDFFSNHPFHIRIEEFSRKTPTPARNGNQFQQYWFYERTRGQYNQGKMKIASKPSELKKYTDRYPEKQVIKMLDLAKYMELLECHPDIVSKGKQKTLQAFAEKIKTEWSKSDLQFNDYYYKRAVAIAIMYQRTDEIIKGTEWYKEKRSYKANIIAYTMSLIFYQINRKYKGYELDFKRIWNEQSIYEELDEQISVLCEEVYHYITGPRTTDNVTEWCKKDACWQQAKEKVWTFNNDFFATLVSKENTESEKQESKQTQALKNEVDAVMEIYNRGEQYWKKMMDWGSSRNLLTPKEISFMRLAINMFTTGRVLSDSRAKVILEARDRMIKNGMPMQF